MIRLTEGAQVQAVGLLGSETGRGFNGTPIYESLITIAFEAVSTKYIDRGDGGRQPVSIIINGQDLLGLVTAIEEPIIQAEIMSQGGEQEEDALLIPGAYMLPSVEEVQAGIFFGPIESHFVLEQGDCELGMTVIFGCSCGEAGCWPLCVRIKHCSDTVEWAGFLQFHRSKWNYALGPYVFDRVAYELAIEKLGTAV